MGIKIHVFACIQRICVYNHTYIYIYKCVYIKYVFVCTDVCVNTRTFLYIEVYIYICVCRYTQVDILCIQLCSLTTTYVFNVSIKNIDLEVLSEIMKT